MSDSSRNAAPAQHDGRTGQGETPAAVAGLRLYMLGIFNYMVLGLLITGFAALGIHLLSVTDDAGAAAKTIRDGTEFPVAIGQGLFLTPFGQAIFTGAIKWALFLAPLALVFVLSFSIERLRPKAAQALFWIFSALMGISLGAIFLVFAQSSIVRVFFITAASFAALSLWGYTTDRDITGFRTFFIIGLTGIVIATLVNPLLASSAAQFVISVAGVLVFAGLTAWDTQRLKNEYIYGVLQGDAAEHSAITGALSLYLNFINLFTVVLQLLGQRD